MRAVSLILVAVTLALGAFLSPVMGAEDHAMVTPNDLQWADVPSLPPGAKWPSSRALWIKRPPSRSG
jgi:hypothetical protein